MTAGMDAEILRLFGRPEAPAGRTSRQRSREASETPAKARINFHGVHILQLRQWIAAAELKGHVARDMLLRLTRSDAAALKRHPDVAVHEVSFASGEMRFMGVRVQEGGVTSSVLEVAPF